ncbi:MAG: Cytosine/purine/uracil/thiamine/allantoin permease family protein [Candidatus Acidoferrum typicum]|nr:Cytosine/purine/uracil/thiamine/allantoin permease family protein [Candidatus Acidoferrum typicum]
MTAPDPHGHSGIHSNVLDAKTIQSSSLYNEDLAPIPASRRSWSTYNYAALWIAMSVNIPTYMLASGMIAGGLSWRQAIFTVFLGNVLVLAPMLLNAHAGAKYGIPFPVFARASFGVLGANVPAILRALVACGWFGIQTWIGGEAINAMVVALVPSWRDYAAGVWICFAGFWLLHVLVIMRGIRTIKILQGVTAPFLLVIGVALLAWAVVKAGGFGTMLAAPSKFQTFGEFFHFFIPSLTGVVGFWATVALNIPDFTRYARSQRAQVLGQALALPTTMTFYSFIGVAVTSATAIIFGQAIWDPVQVLARLGNPVAVVIAMLALLLATLNVNVAANMVSPSNDFSNLSPRLISFRTGGLITCVVGVAVFQPWKLLANYSNYIFGWLVGYSGFLGPIAGVMICDYFIVRKKIILVEDLYLRRGFYEFSGGVNWRAMAALAAGAALAFIGLVAPSLRVLYDYAWFVGFGMSFILYWIFMRAPAATSRPRV